LDSFIEEFVVRHLNSSKLQNKEFLRIVFHPMFKLSDALKESFENMGFELQTNLYMKLKNNIDSEMTENPLLLSLIVILYRYNGKLPESRLEIYRSCTKTLVDKWDAIKNLNISLDENLLKHKENIFANLAFWQYKYTSSDGTKQITYLSVLNEVTKVILRLKLIEDEIEAGKGAEDFLEYARKRSIYFDNTFTHKTFLEFFTGFWIYKYCYLKNRYDELHKIIGDYINNPYWSIVLELLINLIDENQGDSEIIDMIISEQISTGQKSYSFVLRILPSIKNISVNVIKNVIQNSILFCITQLKYKDDMRVFDDLDNKTIYEIFSWIINVSKLERFRDIFQQSFDNIYEIVKSDYDLRTKYHVFYLEVLLLSHNESNLLNKYSSEMIDLSISNKAIFRGLNVKSHTKGEIEFAIKYINNFGVDDFFKDQPLYYSGNSFFSSVAEICITSFFDTSNIYNIEENLNILESAGVPQSQIISHIKQGGIRMWAHNKCSYSDIINVLNEKKDKKHIVAILALYVVSESKPNKEAIKANLSLLKDSTIRKKFSRLLKSGEKLGKKRFIILDEHIV